MSPLLQNDAVWAMFYRDGKSINQIAGELGVSSDELTPLVRPLISSNAAVVDYASKGLAARDNKIANQEKELLNMAELLDKLTDRKKAEAAAAKIKAMKGFRVGKNANYRQSVLIGLREGLWKAPYTLVLGLKVPVCLLIGSVIALVFELASWIVLRPALVIAGLLGRVLPNKETENAGR